MLTMQDSILGLTRFWTERGAMVAQPFNTEVGAGTNNPATIMRVLGPEPWRVAYVEPSVRPDDSRYGENPNRLQTFTQYQVILKPEPGDPQEVYLDSLRALGVDLDAHDIRFVEDNWASPALGAWGLGWEVWLDGLEITQFTYFQQAGGQTLDPVSVEITYGLERILMALQKVDHFKDIGYAPGISYGEVFGQSEYEMSRYYLDDADVEVNRRLYEGYAAEAQRCIDQRLPVPANTYVLKCSHTFNVMDSRGAISTTERARAFAQMRNLARQVSDLWSQRRAELGHPLGVGDPLPPAPQPTEFPTLDSSTTLLVELGTEELPAAEVAASTRALGEALTARLAETRLPHGTVRTYGTPRRLIGIVEDVAPREPDAERTVRGPKVAAAFDTDGKPTKAAEGFARGQGVTVADLQRIDVGGSEHLGITKTDTGRGAAEVLSGVLSTVVNGLRSDKNMRWNDPKLAFSRPIRWLTVLLGEAEVPVAVSALAAGQTTRVLRNDPHPVVDVPSADGYLDFLRVKRIMADSAERREVIERQAVELAAGVGGSIDTAGEAGLLSEIADLVEWPTPILGSFDPKYLELPAAVLTTVMRKHQRYLSVRDAAGELLPYFVAVANGPVDHDVVRAGNEAVLRARYEDAVFFWEADLRVRPVELRAGLAKLAFETTLGSMAERADRIAAVAEALAVRTELAEPDVRTVRRAGELAKFDLASQMVIELTSLAGTMAEQYALRAGEPAEVARALLEMEKPRSTGDALPETLPGAVLALADRLDLLAGLFAVGAQPTGSSDPFALRRAALGLVAILRARPELAAVTIAVGLRAAADRLAAQGVEVSSDALGEAEEFIARRLEQHLLDAGHEHDAVKAVLPLADRPAMADATLAELERLSTDPAFAGLVTAVQRVRRIVPSGTAPTYDVGALTEPAELALHEAVGKLRRELPATPGLEEFASAAVGLVGEVNTFFDEVLVMADDLQLRAARLGLLATVADLAANVLNWDALGTTLN